MSFKSIEKYIYPGVSFILLIWLYLISPHNQKVINPDISNNEYLFVTVKFYFLFVWVVFFLFFYKLLKSKFKNYLYPFLLWNIIFFILSLTFNMGFDLTDEGWQLAKSWGILHGDLQNNSDLIWGSSFVNGLWIAVINKPLLLWSRFGYLLFLPFSGVIIYLILIEYFPKKYVFYSIIVAFLLFNKQFLIYPVINYYYLPVFASLLSFLCLIKYH
ncbi:MAG: hypothetical protein KKD38_05740, partial [Candidatus Delongbacteria bacterium]|nr:hypothetical protein [Candidatus Delongbacteria bacterium]MCG2760711.1 hypothetical protein [Candidatus Delongbacteria bacterium]